MNKFRKSSPEEKTHVEETEQMTPANEPSLYPLEPGYNNTDTSRAAAKAVEGKAERLRKLCLAQVRKAPRHAPGVLLPARAPDPQMTPPLNGDGDPVGITVREACALLGEDNDNLNPRFSELRAAGLIRDSGVRRVNAHSGKNAIAWTPGDDPAKPKPVDNSPPAKPMLRQAYVRGMAAAYYSVAGKSSEDSFLSASETIRKRLAELEPGNDTWKNTD